MCKSWCEAIFAIIIIVLTFVPQRTQMWADWIILVIGVALLLHSFACKSCYAGETMKKRK